MIDARRSAGKAARETLSRKAQGAFALPERDPVAVIEEQNTTRLQTLVPIRVGRMLESPFALYRGSAAMMAHDLADSPVTGCQVIASGDAHLANFGLFASPERRMLFDLNDFDESYPAPWEWDVRRLAASVWIHGRANSYTEAQCADATGAAVRAYRNTLSALFQLTATERYYFQEETDVLEHDPRAQKQRIRAIAEKARKRTSEQVLRKLTTMEEDGKPHIVDQFPVIRHSTKYDLGRITELYLLYLDTLRADIRLLLTQYEVVDYAMRIVGVGSVGTRCWLLLLQGRPASRSSCRPRKHRGRFWRRTGRSRPHRTRSFVRSRRTVRFPGRRRAAHPPGAVGPVSGVGARRRGRRRTSARLLPAAVPRHEGVRRPADPGTGAVHEICSTVRHDARPCAQPEPRISLRRGISRQRGIVRPGDHRLGPTVCGPVREGLRRAAGAVKSGRLPAETGL